MHILIIGCGYVGERFALQAIEKGWKVSALTRNDERAEVFEKQGIQPLLGDVLNTESLENLPEADLCLYAVGYDRKAEAAKRAVYIQGLKNVLQQINQKIPRLIYVSSTSVYGESTGDWVNEETDPRPTNESGEICLAAEDVVREFYPLGSDDREATILRLSGIYGPNRLIGRKEQLSAGKPISGNPAGWLNLIHIDDILQTLFLVAEHEACSPLYLLSDKQPNRRIDFYSELATHLGTPSPVMHEETSTNLGKRCDSSRIRNELGLQLLRPSICAGIAASITPESHE